MLIQRRGGAALVLDYPLRLALHSPRERKHGGNKLEGVLHRDLDISRWGTRRACGGAGALSSHDELRDVDAVGKSLDISRNVSGLSWTAA